MTDTPTRLGRALLAAALDDLDPPEPVEPDDPAFLAQDDLAARGAYDDLIDAPDVNRGEAEVTEVSEYRVGRNFVRVGDYVRAKSSRPRRRDGFVAQVTAVRSTFDRVVEVRVVVRLTADGHRQHPQRGMTRVLPPERIERLDQARMARRLGREVTP